jgi:protein SCO1/2
LTKTYVAAPARLCALALAALLALLTVACTGSGESAEPLPSPGPEFLGDVLDEPMEKPAFSLTDTAGETFDLQAQTEGRITLLYFGYTYCPDVCPSHMSDLATVLEQWPALADRVRVVFVSVDPERDTPERLRTWLDLFDESFVGLTGTEDEVQHAAHLTFGDEWHTTEKYYSTSGNYTVSHAAFVVAYGEDGLAEVTWPVGTRTAEYVNDLAILATKGNTGS